MILFILGVLDLLSGIELFLLNYGIFSGFGLIFGIYLIVKGLIFIKSISSVLDLIGGIVIVLMFYEISVPFYWLFSLWLIQKGIFSLFN